MTSSSTRSEWWSAGPSRVSAAGPPASWLAGAERCPAGGPRARLAGDRVWPELEDAAASTPEHAPEPPPRPGREPELAFTEAEVARLCAAAAARAAGAALADARQRRAEEGLRVEGRLAAGLAALAEAVAARRERVRAEAAALGAALGRTLAREALRREPLAAAGEMLGEMLAELRAEPEVTVAVAAAHADELRAALAGIASGAAYAGAIEVRTDPVLRPGEVRLVWRDGWAERLLADLEARADAALAPLTGGRLAGNVVEIVETAGDITP